MNGRARRIRAVTISKTPSVAQRSCQRYSTPVKVFPEGRVEKKEEKIAPNAGIFFLHTTQSDVFTVPCPLLAEESSSRKSKDDKTINKIKDASFDATPAL